jgi:hypothetical protein
VKTLLKFGAVFALAITAVSPLQAQGYNRDAFWRGAPEGPRERIDWLQQRIDRGIRDGSLDRGEAARSQRELNGIRRTVYDLRARDGGRLSPTDRDMVQSRLDDLSQRIRWRKHNGW